MNYENIIIMILIIIIIILNNRYYENFSDLKFNDLKQYSCIIVGTARDIEPYIVNSIIKLKNISNLFSYCPIVIYENDSNDRTLELLNNEKF
jgi:hypothetical protein